MNHLPEPLLHAYLDDELTLEKRSQVEAHLAACTACAEQARELRSLFRTLDNLPEIPISRDLAPAVLQEIRAAETRFPRLRWLVGLELFAAIFILAFTLPTLYQRVSFLLADMNISAALNFPFWPPRIIALVADLLSSINTFSALSLISVDQLVFILWLLPPLAAFWALSNAFLLRDGRSMRQR